MPANLTPQYLVAEDKYRQATTPEEKMDALQEMLRELPKHKGTEKIFAEIKRKISEQKKENEKTTKKKSVSYVVDNHGYSQIVFIGPSNAGRSSLINSLTNADLKVADYPFTTRLPQPAMSKFDNIPLQLVDTPPISSDHTEPWLAGVVRATDAVVLVLDICGDNVLEDVDLVEKYLAEQKVYLRQLKNATTGIETANHKTTLMVINKADIPDANDYLEMIHETYSDWDYLTVSAHSGQNLEELKKRMFELLQLIRIYPKPPGKKVDFNEPPILLQKGQNVVDLATKIHQDLAKTLKSARIWNSSKFPDGQKIPVDCILEDGNIIELEA